MITKNNILFPRNIICKSVSMLLTLDMDIKSKYSFFLGNKASFTVGALFDLKKKKRHPLGLR